MVIVKVIKSIALDDGCDDEFFLHVQANIDRRAEVRDLAGRIVVLFAGDVISAQVMYGDRVVRVRVWSRYTHGSATFGYHRATFLASRGQLDFISSVL